jgi:dTDP-3,4-didehydro-2,6-dideoxy-alpha-D-glucose 3-reductase
MSNEKINKIAVWGLGKHAIKNILPALRKIKNIEIIGIQSRNINTVSENCKEFNCKTWESPEEMLLDPLIDIIYLSTPPGLHFQQAKKILKSNKHLWCEKPLTINYQHTKDLIELSNKNLLSICEGFMYFYHPQFITLKKYLDKNIIGEIKTIYSQFGAHWLKSSAKPGFRFDKELGGSSLYDVGSYPLSLISNLFEKEPINVIHSSIKKKSIDQVDMSGLAYLRIGENIDCIIEWANDRSYRNNVDIWGENGSLNTDFIFSKKMEYKPKLEFKDLYGSSNITAIKASNHFELMIKSFSEIIRDENKTIKEKKRILKLASLLDEIKRKSI